MNGMIRITQSAPKTVVGMSNVPVAGQSELGGRILLTSW